MVVLAILLKTSDMPQVASNLYHIMFNLEHFPNNRDGTRRHLS